jgi:A/G-specific adenine glycosylase
MLAQTQVDRVVPKFEAFVARFSSFHTLAAASRADVLRAWRGLGYNSRAVRLHSLAQAVVACHGGRLPSDRDALRALPGIGAYTASAVRAFAFGLDDVAIDTNVGRIVQRVFFGLEYPQPVGSQTLAQWARAFLPPGHAHDWNSAMMDLGATICTARAPRCLLCPLRRDCTAAPIDAARLDRLRSASPKRRGGQSAIPFEHTKRYARGRIVDRLRDLPPGEAISLLDLHAAMRPLLAEHSIEKLREHITALERDGLVTHDGTQVALRE